MVSEWMRIRSKCGNTKISWVPPSAVKLAMKAMRDKWVFYLRTSSCTFHLSSSFVKSIMEGVWECEYFWVLLQNFTVSVYDQLYDRQYWLQNFMATEKLILGTMSVPWSKKGYSNTIRKRQNRQIVMWFQIKLISILPKKVHSPSKEI